MRISDWSSDVCSSDLQRGAPGRLLAETRLQPPHRRRAAQQGTAVRPASAPAVAPTASPASLPAAPGDGIVAVVLKGYPRLSETFIEQEILALQQRGFRLQLVSLRNPTDRKRPPVPDENRASVCCLTEYLYQEPLRVLRRSEEHTSELQSLMRISY